MNALRRMKTLVLIFALVVIVTGGLVATFADNAQARPKCCIWVMYCSEIPPYPCWDVCIPVPCP